MTNKTVSFHDQPPTEENTNKFKDALKKAKETQRDRPGNLEGTPRFDQAGSWSEAPPAEGSFLSPQTKQGLEAMARSAKKAQQTSENSKAVQESTSTTEKEEVKEPDTPLTEEEKLRAAIEARLEEIDIGQYLMSGEIRQEIPIIPDKLEVTLKSVTDLEESYVDTLISKDPSTLSNRQFLRKMNELALCIHIHSVNGNKWPKTVDGDGTINEDAINVRLRHIRKLSSPVFNLLTPNLSWFIDRINKSLTASALGNG